ncbi:septum site-determining protein MinC [Algiphilus sp.]|uniref:septum site-determining protein MinC n=1 Tax=Algiphilus sp. TaxID=1872431 RepID=UPI0025C3FD2B|nr:septum site-determining protein MinC [Algiphilus sp.]MCK5769376.1 septum site-determining protein MinC [Algiphilus sp.]
MRASQIPVAIAVNDVDNSTATEVKGMMLPVTRVRMTARGASDTVADFRAWAESLPEMMRAMPIVLDAAHHTACSSLLEVAREHGLSVLGVADGKLAPTASAAGLAVLSEEMLMAGRAGGARRPAPEPEAAPAPAEAVPAPEHPPATGGSAARVVHAQVRSGQQVYADGADLVVLGTVSPGAEVIADGHIHIYGSLRGRAIAGARGDTRARIFCRRFEPELVACAGVYDVAEKLRPELRGKAVQVWLDGEDLQFAAID